MSIAKGQMNGVVTGITNLELIELPGGITGLVHI